MFDFSNVVHTVNSLDNLTRAILNHQVPDFQPVTEELTEANQTLDKMLVSEAAMKAILGLRKDLREEVIRTLSKQLLTNIPLLQIQAGTAQSQQNQFSKELKKFEERLQYVLNSLKKSRGERAADVEQDQADQ